MLHLFQGAASAAPLVAFFSSSHRSSHPVTEVNLHAFGKSAHRKWIRRADRFSGPAQWAADEFAFERAIEAYEELIDASARGFK